MLIIFSNFSRFLHRICLFYPKIVEYWPIQLGIRANIIWKVMNYSSAKFDAISSPNMDTEIFSNLLWILHRIWLFCLKIVKSWPIQLWNIANVLSNAMKYNGANLCANSATNMHVDNIFQFSLFFAHILTLLAQNCKVLTYTAWNHS